MDEILKGKTVLVVDDTGVARMLAADILGAVGIEILEAETGEQALSSAAEERDRRLPARHQAAGHERHRAVPHAARNADATATRR